MPIIKNKSDENYDAADLLIDNGKLTASIHCLYYGAYQRAMYVMNKSGIGYEEQKDNYTNYCSDLIAKKSSLKKLGSHEFLIKECIDLIKSKTDDDILICKMNRFFLYLKTYRKKADYENISINKSDVKDCKQKAAFLKKTIDEFIKNNFAV